MQKILIGNEASFAVADALGKGTCTINRSLVTDFKAIKNQTEIEGFRKSHIRDGAALARCFSWLEQHLNKGVEINESRGSDQLTKVRSLRLFHFINFLAWELTIFLLFQ
jgi:Xaa-Pro aminopeptidase